MARPSSFCEKYIAKARTACERGATDAELASLLKIHPATLYRWKLDFPDFCEAIKAGKEIADERVERSLFHKAVGFDTKRIIPVKLKIGPNQERVELVEVDEHVPADTTAAIFWLKNRRKEQWRDKHEVEHSVDGDLAAVLMAARSRDAKPVIEIVEPE
jgi:hypothetical protein